jgi:hypothetical protein
MLVELLHVGCIQYLQQFCSSTFHYQYQQLLVRDRQASSRFVSFIKLLGRGIFSHVETQITLEFISFIFLWNKTSLEVLGTFAINTWSSVANELDISINYAIWKRRNLKHVDGNRKDMHF